MILSRLTFYLESIHLLSTCQVSFRPGRSKADLAMFTHCPPSDVHMWTNGSVLPSLDVVVLKSMSYVRNATHPIPCPFLLVQLPPVSQLKLSPFRMVLLGATTIL